MSKKIYLAYGSNLNVKQMGYRCPEATVLGTTFLEGFELIFRGRHEAAVATVEPKDGSRVPVLLWETSTNDERALDHYEGYPYLYRKECIEVVFNGELVTAYIYMMNGDRPISTPGCHYYATIREGYKDCGFDEAFLKDAALKSAMGGSLDI